MSELSIDEQFEETLIISRRISKNISKNNFIKLYAYFKQAREGNISFERPSILNMDFLNKWKAWKKLENMSSEDAKINFIALVKHIIKSFDYFL
jgi:diazepam-binding inhibitor (GABA receptor modulator, acyl-CoA-binding protein)